MNDIINQLLFFTRLDQGSEPVNMEEVDLSALAADICSEQRLISCRNISVKDTIEPGIVVETDRSLFTRMLNNLFSNAFKYGRENGTITLTLTRNGDDAVLKLTDDGIGISRENLEKIWNRFYQVEPSRNEETSGGLGLGLSIVKQITSLLGGEISVESLEGKGTSFTFVLNCKKIKNLKSI